MSTTESREEQLFRVEIDGWCFGLKNYPGTVPAPVLYRVLRELTVPFKKAIENRIVFDLGDVAARFTEAVPGLADEQTIVFYMVGQLPNPAKLNEEARSVLAIILELAEDGYPGAGDRFERRWTAGRRGCKSAA